MSLAVLGAVPGKAFRMLMTTEGPSKEIAEYAAFLRQTHQPPHLGTWRQGTFTSSIHDVGAEVRCLQLLPETLSAVSSRGDHLSIPLNDAPPVRKPLPTDQEGDMRLSHVPGPWPTLSTIPLPESTLFCQQEQGLLMTLTTDDTLRVWSVLDRHHPSVRIRLTPTCLCATTDGERVFLGGLDGHIYVVDLQDQVWWKATSQPGPPVRSIRVVQGPRGPFRYLVWGRHDGSVSTGRCFHNRADEKACEVLSTRYAHTSPVTCLSIDAVRCISACDGGQIVVASLMGDVWWRRDFFEPILVTVHDEERLVIAAGNRVRILDFASEPPRPRNAPERKKKKKRRS